jgi:hypothetical protein
MLSGREEMRSKTFVVATLLLFGIQPLSAQDSPLEPGARVRLQVCDPHSTLFTRRGAASVCTARMEGTFVAVSRDTFRLQTEMQVTPSTIPFTSISQLEVSRGRKSHTLLGLAVGSLVGLGAGALAGGSVDCYALGFRDDGVTCVLIGAGAGLVAGSILGAVTGALIRTERWEEVPLEQVRLQVARQPGGGLGLGLSVAF